MDVKNGGYKPMSKRLNVLHRKGGTREPLIAFSRITIQNAALSAVPDLGWLDIPHTVHRGSILSRECHRSSVQKAVVESASQLPDVCVLRSNEPGAKSGAAMLSSCSTVWATIGWE